MGRNKLEQLLGELTLEGRAEAVYQLCLKSHDISNLSEGHTREAVRYFEHRFEHQKAGKIAERNGWDQIAAVTYKKAGLPSEEYVPVVRRALHKLEQRREFDLAGAFAEQMEMYDKAGA